MEPEVNNMKTSFVACLRVGLVFSLIGAYVIFQNGGEVQPTAVDAPALANTASNSGSGDFAGAPTQGIGSPMPAPLLNPLIRASSQLSQLPDNEQASFQAALEEARYAAWKVEGGIGKLPQNAGVTHFAANPSQNLTARFLGDGGVRFESGTPGKSWSGTLRLRQSSTDRHVSWNPTGTRTEADHGPVVEWYSNTSRGFEQGFTISERTGNPDPGQPLTLRITLDLLRVERDPKRAGDLIFVDPESGTSLLSYRELKVWDAHGHQLAAEMRPTDEGLLIAINDREAAFPLTVDPLIASLEQQVEAGPAAGEPVAIAMEGDTLAVASTEGNYVFSRQQGTWKFQKSLSGPPGRSVAISQGIMVFGQPTINQAAVYNSSGFVHALAWSSGDTFPAYNFGWSVDIEGGSAIVVGAPPTVNTPLAYRGRAFVFTLAQGGPGGAYGLAAMLNPPFSASTQAFGYAVTMVGLDSAAVGAPGKDYTTPAVAGSVYEYTYNSFGSPIENASLRRSLAPSDPQPGNLYGSSISTGSFSLSLVVGAPGWDASVALHDVGAVYVESTRLPGLSNAAVNDGLGCAVSTSPGGVILAGSHGGKTALYDSTTGGVINPPVNLAAATPSGEIFTTSVAVGDTIAVVASTGGGPVKTGGLSFFGSVGAGNWPLQQSIDFEGGAADDNFGLSVALDGDVAVIGVLNDDTPGWLNSGSLYVFRRTGDIWKREIKLEDPQGAPQDRFGVAVGISGNTIVAGSDFDDEVSLGTTFTDCGSATVFTRTNGVWLLQQKLVPAFGNSWTSGRAVAIDGDSVVIGIPNANTSTGLVSTYRRIGSTWQAQGTTGSPFNQTGALFGFSISLHGNRLAVGSPLQNVTVLDGGKTDAGRVDIFTRAGITSSWSSQKSYNSTSPETGGRFGFAVAMDDASVVIGEPGNPPGWTGGVSHATSNGKSWAAAWNGSTWSALSGITPPQAAANLYFGFATAVQGDRALVSAIGWQGNRGAVYLYQKNGGAWTFQYQLPVTAMATDDWFGCSVALSGDTAIAGRYGFDAQASLNAGAARIYLIIDQLVIRPNGGNLVLTWPPVNGLALWQSDSLQGGTWTKIPGSESAATYTQPFADAQKRFFRLAPP
ncbi:MAG: hypothetical protein JWL81_2724 [Verrucomicrobiales bacterium]|nr:hypothetical protein [Verrucomicrobiales bacterium]